MSVLLKSHVYRNRKPKGSPYINMIQPVSDMVVSKALFDAFEDVTDTGTVIELHPEYFMDRKSEILETTGADA